MKKISSLLAVLLLATNAQADIAGGEVNLGFFGYSPSGTIEYQGDRVDVEDTLGWDEEQDIFLKAYVEHPVPLLPNVRLAYTKLSTAGTGSVSNFEFASQLYNGSIDTAFDLDVVDATLYYEILDNWLSADVGLNIKSISGSAKVESEEADISAILPTLYAKARFDIPTTDFSIQAEADYVSYDGSTVYDASISARYTYAFGVGVEAGYRSYGFKLDDIDDVYSDMNFDGVYMSIIWDF
jgi:outer membrane protein